MCKIKYTGHCVNFVCCGECCKMWADEGEMSCLHCEDILFFKNTQNLDGGN